MFKKAAALISTVLMTLIFVGGSSAQSTGYTYEVNNPRITGYNSCSPWHFSYIADTNYNLPFQADVTETLYIDGQVVGSSSGTYGISGASTSYGVLVENWFSAYGVYAVGDTYTFRIEHHITNPQNGASILTFTEEGRCFGGTPISIWTNTTYYLSIQPIFPTFP